MSYLIFTILAYLFNSIAVTIDKFLLVKAIPNPLTYVFYISVFSLLILFALPFTPARLASGSVAGGLTLFLASLSTLLWTLGAYLMFKAIQIGQVSRVVPIIGALIPIILLIHAFIFSTITNSQLLASVILILGLIAITMNSHTCGRSYTCMGELLLEILSAFFFAVSYLILKEAYLRENFLTVLVYSKLILIPVITVILLIPTLRKIVLSRPKKAPGILFLFGQALGGIQQLLLTFSISLASPALVNSLAGLQYVFLFIFALFLSKKFPQIFGEKYSMLTLFYKFTGIGLIGVGLYLLGRI